MPLHISADDLPVLYEVADRSSLEAQEWFLRATKCRLGALLGAAVFGLCTWIYGRSLTDWAGVSAAICFALALLIELYLLRNKPERTWYEGRAAAESVRTLSWRYMMRAEPFASESPQDAVEALFLDRLNDVLDVLKDLDLAQGHSQGEQITPAMRDVRAASLQERKSVYEEDRVQQQQEWYSNKSRWNRHRAGQWTMAMLGAEAAGITAAILKAAGALRGDLFGLFSTVIAAMTAWLQTKQHRTLATAYSVTALELASIRSRIVHQQSDVAWAQFVGDAEDAFSREHTLWQASRGVAVSARASHR